MRTSARHHERIGHEVFLPFDEVAAHRWHVLYGAPSGHIALLRMTFAEVVDKPRECLFARSQQDGVGMLRRLVGQRRDMKSAHGHIGALPTVVVGYLVGAVGVGHIHLDAYQVRVVVECQLLHVLVHYLHFVVVAEIGCQRGESQWREQRVLDGPPIWAVGFLQGRQYHFYFHTLCECLEL